MELADRAAAASAGAASSNGESGSSVSDSKYEKAQQFLGSVLNNSKQEAYVILAENLWCMCLAAVGRGSVSASGGASSSALPQEPVVIDDNGNELPI